MKLSSGFDCNPGGVQILLILINQYCEGVSFAETEIRLCCSYSWRSLSHRAAAAMKSYKGPGGYHLALSMMDEYLEEVDWSC